MKMLPAGGNILLALLLLPMVMGGCDAKQAHQPTAKETGSESLLALGKSYKAAGRYADAMKFYLQAAEQGNAQAQAYLGAAYYDGSLGVPRDREAAVQWLRKSAAQTCIKGVDCLLGCIYENGQGVPQNYAEALGWYRKAADQGDTEAQIRMGIVLMRGAEGVPQDLAAAYTWLSLAAAHGPTKLTTELASYRVELLRRMTPEQIAEGQRRVTEFISKHAPAASI